jgi:hypothetical protein
MYGEEIGYEGSVQLEGPFAGSHDMQVQVIDDAHQILHYILVVGNALTIH